ncbi:hypothetical protein ACFQJ6_02685 [Halorussus caseinilyticus]|uniref:Small CPxCG-related zinc finger protein n=1 Tax=Halorussus caseinilyticus TaxID=3034025 RepID=A0ABD5WHI9_9EURY|nr:hypothetical protein [Halorussus sp. DT72]
MSSTPFGLSDGHCPECGRPITALSATGPDAHTADPCGCTV